MKGFPSFATIAALMGDPARALMLDLLMDGEAHSASALAEAAGVSPQTASGHLARMRDARLVEMEARGRHRFYRLGGHRVAEAVEGLALLADDLPQEKVQSSRDIRAARTCYDHLAGRLGVALTQAMMKAGYLRLRGEAFHLTGSGRRFLEEDLGLDVEAALGKRRKFARACLDWSEREPHLAGSLGAALAERSLQAGWVARQAEGRGLTVTRKGQAAFRRHFGVAL
ncbi:winged helix-turn-helix domain-containing protein [uncultured Parvibaculum sp.]|uniref:ArsR/SmtB family transcription factor n=1 Tax=uncultured Parvibaculum sp. TaxID=291828 RepID=UPI0030DD8842